MQRSCGSIPAMSQAAPAGAELACQAPQQAGTARGRRVATSVLASFSKRVEDGVGGAQRPLRLLTGLATQRIVTCAACRCCLEILPPPAVDLRNRWPGTASPVADAGTSARG